jgi:Fungal protein kinase
MHDKENNSGVLNDSDLSYWAGNERHLGNERPGTLPFLALDLLADKAIDGPIARLYRHDAKSFAWVLLWICCRYEGGHEIHDAPLQDLVRTHYKQCFEKKLSMPFTITTIRPTMFYEDHWFAVTFLIDWVIKKRLATNSWSSKKQRGRAGPLLK